MMSDGMRKLGPPRVDTVDGCEPFGAEHEGGEWLGAVHDGAHLTLARLAQSPPPDEGLLTEALATMQHRELLRTVELGATPMDDGDLARLYDEEGLVSLALRRDHFLWGEGAHLHRIAVPTRAGVGTR